jgi:hypothetical protein
MLDRQSFGALLEWEGGDVSWDHEELLVEPTDLDHGRDRPIPKSSLLDMLKA